jgi:hypothetical protein
VIAVGIVRRNPDQVGFAVQPRRWVVERFFAWINRNRRLAKDFEATIAWPEPSSTPHPSCSSSADWHAPHDFRNRLLALGPGNQFWQQFTGGSILGRTWPCPVLAGVTPAEFENFSPGAKFRTDNRLRRN